MSIHNLACDDYLRVTLGDAPCGCFLCGEEVEHVAVVWQGEPRADSDEAMILLHPECAQNLAIRLIRDGFEAQRLLSGKQPLAGIDSTLLPSGDA